MNLNMKQAIDDFWAARQPHGDYPMWWAGRLSQDEGYRIQLALNERHAARGEKQAGWKVGVTAKAIREQFGLPEPVFATLFEHGRWPSGALCALGSLKEPGFENELCLTLGSPLRGPGVTEDQARRAVRGVAPAMEIIETRGPNTLPGMNLMIADNGQQRAFVVGAETAYDPKAHDLGMASVEIFIDERSRDRGVGSAVMESSPIASIVWLANKLAQFGRGLDAGQCVMTGSFTRQFAIDRPMTIEARFAPFGSATAEFF